MKKYLIPTVAVLLVAVVAWTAFGQDQQQGRQRGNMRERMQNMTAEEREQFMARMRERGGAGRGMFTSPEAQEKAIKTIEEQLAKLKAAQITRPEGGFQDLSEEQRTKLREDMQLRRQALQTIIAQVALLEGRRQPAAGAEAGQFLIINTADLKPIQEAAVKEKATETTQLLERLIGRGGGRGVGGRGQGAGAGQRPQGAVSVDDHQCREW